MFFNQFGDKAIYFDRKTHELLEAPKSKLLDTEKSSRMNRHIPLLVVLFIAGGGGISSFFSLFLQGTYSMTTFWSVILIWIAEFAFITMLVERALYRNINRAQVTTQTVSLFTICDSEDLKEKNLSEKEKRNNTYLFNALLFTIPAVGFYYVYDFISRFKDLLGQPIGGEIFKIIFAGLLLGIAFVAFNQNYFVRILKLSQQFEEGKISVICRSDDDPGVYLEVSVGPDGAILTKELHDYKAGA
jgi:hypothetical protein